MSPHLGVADKNQLGAWALLVVGVNLSADVRGTLLDGRAVAIATSSGVSDGLGRGSLHRGQCEILGTRTQRLVPDTLPRSHSRRQQMSHSQPGLWSHGRRRHDLTKAVSISMSP